MSKRARMEGFLVFDYFDRYDEAAGAMLGWIAEGQLHAREQIVDGLDSAPSALNMLFTGGNTGKLLVQVAPDPGSA